MSRYREVAIDDVDEEELELSWLRVERNRRCARRTVQHKSGERANRPLIDPRTGKEVRKHHRGNRVEAKKRKSDKSLNVTRRRRALERSFRVIFMEDCSIA